MTKRSAERAEFLNCVFVTAIEGGINYWGYVMEYRWDVKPEDSFKAVVSEMYDDANAEHVINASVITRGLSRIRKGEVRSCYDKEILLADRDNDAGEIDSLAADVIIQAGLFGKIIYG